MRKRLGTARITSSPNGCTVLSPNKAGLAPNTPWQDVRKWRGRAARFCRAARWYRLAAEQGHTGAQFYLGGMYYAGEGVPRDYVQAFVWFSLSEAGRPGRLCNQEPHQSGGRDDACTNC